MARGLDDYRCEYCGADLSDSRQLDAHSGRHSNLDPGATSYPTGTGRPLRTNRVDLLRFETDGQGFTQPKRRRGPFNPVRVAA